jgi:hypothetical protein
MSRFIVLALFAIAFPAAVLAQSSKAAPANSKTATGPRTYSSPNFVVLTDLDEKEAEELLTRLETMIKLVSGYYGRKNPRVIEMYVAKDIASWPEEVLAKLEPEGIRKIQRTEGVTMSISRRVAATGQPIEGKSIVYAYADRGVPQHEAVHAYCAQAFGSTGPVWYSEGMAEVGQYWRENDKSVQIHEGVLKHLQTSEPKPLADLVDRPLEMTGDSWENYASRWALCHLLGFNENYTQRFKPLGLGLVTENPSASFKAVYGPQAKEIDFEYHHFLAHIDNGYRVDLCSWDWKSRGKALKGKSTQKAQVKAARGWQAAKIKVLEGTEYAFSTSGTWKLTKDGEEIGPEGNSEGEGKLVGVIFKDYELSEPFDLGKDGAFTAPSEGDLFLRCSDGWGAIGDNSGMVTATFKLASEK